ncbi:hypothetical protein [Kitasatospora sp. NPDC015120]|uniref:hypothetical protein n=1 Tax=Kitasatospora sp. NPDC015120 TaxID=3364023 RepID=UPI0036F48B7C
MKHPVREVHSRRRPADRRRHLRSGRLGGGGEDDGWYGLAASAHLERASFLRLADGSWAITATAAGDWTASGVTMSRAQHQVQLITGPGGQISGEALHAAFGGTGVLTSPRGRQVTADDVDAVLENTGARTAAVGDPDTDEGLVITPRSRATS